MGGEKRNRETNSIYEGDDLEEAEYEVRKFLELLGKEIQIRVNIKDAAIDGIETINKILKDINNVVLNNNVIFYFVDGKAESIFGEYLLYLESKVGDGTCKVVVKSLKLFLNVVLDISNLEYGGEFESLKPMVLGMLLNKNIIENLMDVIHKLELQYNNEYSPANRELIFYEDVLFDYFNFLESVLELDPQKSSSGLLKYRKLLSWLLNSLDDSNGGSASGNGVKANATIGNASQNKIEILSIMFQNVTYSDLLELDTFSVNIMDLLLVKLANMGLIEGEVVGSENREFIYNIVDIMCSLLLFEKERLNFVELEGLELMLKFIKEKVFLRSLSVKVLSFALICDSNVNNKFVNLLGLKQIFALLSHSVMELNRKPSKTKQQQDTDEHICSIIKSLLHHCKGNELKRVLNKLTSENFDKLKCLAKLREYYSKKIFNSLGDEETDAEITETIATDAGLFIVQLIDIILFYTFYYRYFEFLDSGGTSADRNGILDTIKELGLTVDEISTSIDDYSDSLENEELTLIKHMRSKVKI